MAGQKIQATLPEKLIEELERLSKEKGLSKSVIIALALEEYLKKGESNERK